MTSPIPLDIYNQIGIHISPSLWHRIVKYYENTYTGVIPNSYPLDLFAEHRIISAKAEMKRLQSLKISKKATCLDAGCGLGVFVALALKGGYNYCGYEIDEELIAIGQALLKENNLPANRIMSWNKLQQLKPKRKFDFISAFEVIEHVQDLSQFIGGISTVLARNGEFFAETPNYLIPYESHFYVFMPLFLPRSVKWMICRFMSRSNRAFFNELNFATPGKLEKAFKAAGLDAINLGKKEWIDMVTSDDFSDRSVYLATILRPLNKLRMIPIVVFLANYNLYTPLVYLAKRQEV